MAFEQDGELENARPNWPWVDAHTETRNNRKIWKTDRPVPFNYSVPMDWHHIVPWNQLCAGWNRIHGMATAVADAIDPAARRRQEKNIKLAWDVLQSWLHAAGARDAARTIRQMKAGNYNDQEDMAEKVCWAKWNLVEGPTNTYRTLTAEDPLGGDPGGDSCDPFSCGSGNLRARSLSLVAWAGELRTGNLATLKTRLHAFRSYRNVALQKFDVGVWERLTGARYELFKRPIWVSEGRFDRFGNATSPNHHAKWRKAINPPDPDE